MTKPTETRLRVSQLILDGQNPRLPEILHSQQDAIKAMARSQGDKIVALAQHIVDNGTNPASLAIVTPLKREKGLFRVLDGNRRVTALKLLESPTLAEGILTPSSATRLKRLAADFEKKPVAELNCILFENAEDADTWIQLTHRGQHLGAGLVEWDGQVAARYDARMGKKSAALHILEYLKSQAQFSDKTQRVIDGGRFPITNLTRLINTRYVRKKLGIGISEGTVTTQYSDKDTTKALRHVVEDLGSGATTVSAIKSQEQRIDYINKLPHGILPDPQKSLGGFRPLGTVAPERVKGRKKKPQDASVASRTTLIPRVLILHIDNPRIDRIYRELKKLSVDDFPNAGAVMLRVFLELSLDHHLVKKAGWAESQINNATLANKLHTAVNRVRAGGAMTDAQLLPARQAANGQTLVAASAKAMNAFVHSKYFSPKATELKASWDDLQPFLEELWRV